MKFAEEIFYIREKSPLAESGTLKPGWYYVNFAGDAQGPLASRSEALQRFNAQFFRSAPVQAN